ncbi:MAG: hypothetical protein KDD50_05685 [Bdellovibrionales bacterium]|nr:hypothetical protein [Bdellovibrionales bacterium]
MSSTLSGVGLKYFLESDKERTVTELLLVEPQSGQEPNLGIQYLAFGVRSFLKRLGARGVDIDQFESSLRLKTWLGIQRQLRDLPQSFGNVSISVPVEIPLGDMTFIIKPRWEIQFDGEFIQPDGSIEKKIISLYSGLQNEDLTLIDVQIKGGSLEKQNEVFRIFKRSMVKNCENVFLQL